MGEVAAQRRIGGGMTLSQGALVFVGENPFLA